MLSGLSIWALFLLVALFTFHGDAFYQKYWIWLLGGSLYAPSLLIFSYLRRKKLFAELYPKIIDPFGNFVYPMAICVGGFFKYRLFDGAADFAGGCGADVLDCDPDWDADDGSRGMGTFDVLMILGMSQIGLSQDQTVVWLLYYRLFYYLVPFLSGVILFLTQTSVKLNRFFDNLPRIFLQRIAHIVVVVAVYFAGIMMVLLSTVTNLSNISRFFEFILPFSFNFLE